MNLSIKWLNDFVNTDGIEIKASRALANLKSISPTKVFHKTLDAKVYNNGYEINSVNLYDLMV